MDKVTTVWDTVEMSEVVTQLAFYAGLPKAWTALRMEKEVYGEK